MNIATSLAKAGPLGALIMVDGVLIHISISPLSRAMAARRLSGFQASTRSFLGHRNRGRADIPKSGTANSHQRICHDTILLQAVCLKDLNSITYNLGKLLAFLMQVAVQNRSKFVKIRQPFSMSALWNFAGALFSDVQP